MRVSTPITVALPDDGVLFAESVHAADFRMSERADPYHKLILVLSGALAYRESGGVPARADSGSVIAVPFGVAHQMTDERPSTLFLLCVDDSFLRSDPELEGLWRIVTRSPRRVLRVGRPARQRLESIWRRALAEKSHSRPGARTVTRALAADAVVLLARLPGEGSNAEPGERVAAVMREVSETFFESWDLDRAASRSALSRRRFTELFRQASGSTFLDFLTGRRLDHASRLLESGEHSVTGVIFSCGFSDVSHFYRVFRKRFGVAPGQYPRIRR